MGSWTIHTGRYGLGTHPKLEFREKLQNHYPLLRALATRLTNGGNEAEDLTQRVIERVLENESKYRDHKNLKALLLHILRNLFIDHLRRDARHVSSEGMVNMTEAPTVFPDEPGPLDVFTIEDVRNALKAMPSEFRQAFELKEFERLSYREIAKLQGVPERTVGSRIYRARAQLRTRLLKEFEKRRVGSASEKRAPLPRGTTKSPNNVHQSARAEADSTQLDDDAPSSSGRDV